MSDSFYMFDAASLPDELYTPETPVERWIERCHTAGPQGFAKGAFTKLVPIKAHVLLERTVGIALWMVMNMLPFALPITLAISRRYLFLPLLVYTATLWLIALPFGLYYSYFAAPLKGEGAYAAQYMYTERNNSKYVSLRLLWPKSLHYPAAAEKPLLFLAIPHGFAPLGITCYPLWSKLFSRRLCRWTTAPVVLRLPLIGTLMRKIGYIAAEKKAIEETLVKREESVGVVLDGVAGMFYPGGSKEETAFVKQRKGIIKIALRAGATVVPVYGFGHTDLWTILADPFGWMRAISVRLDTSVVLGLGRWGWPLGPPKRAPVTVALGEPISCPHCADPTKELVTEYHDKLLDGYKKLFDTHKAAAGIPQKELRFV